MKLLLYPAVEDERQRAICTAAGDMLVVNATNVEQATAEIAAADAFFGKLTPSLLAAANKLRWVQSPTASLEHYVFPELIAHACTLSNMRGLFSDVIADHVFGYIICFARNFHIYVRQQQQACWSPVGGENERSNFVSGPGTISGLDRAHLHLADCTLGIVGLGKIGEEIAQRGRAFGMRVVAVDAVRQDAPSGVEWLGPPQKLPQLLAESDFVVIAAPHTPQTERLFGQLQFQQMKQTAYLINIGRGAIVDLTSLCSALDQGGIAGAGLDVFEIEPLPREHPLWRMENVILTPHVAGCSPRIAERHLEVLLDNIGRFRRGEPLQNVVDKANWF